MKFKLFLVLVFGMFVVFANQVYAGPATEAEIHAMMDSLPGGTTNIFVDSNIPNYPSGTMTQTLPFGNLVPSSEKSVIRYYHEIDPTCTSPSGFPDSHICLSGNLYTDVVVPFATLLDPDYILSQHDPWANLSTSIYLWFLLFNQAVPGF
jgi:hypothetical protein